MTAKMCSLPQFSFPSDDADNECKTKNLNTCQFPFLYEGQMYYECTSLSFASTGKQGMCPIRLSNILTRQASLNAADWEICGRDCALQKYTTNKDINIFLKKVARNNPRFVRLIHVGDSVLGGKILGVTITKDVNTRALLRPMVRYVGNMHGNEVVGRELLLSFINALVEGYKIRDTRVTKMIENANLTIIPTMNPDGFDRSEEAKCTGGDYATGRYNEG